MRIVACIATFIGGLFLSYLLISMGILDVIEGAPISQRKSGTTLQTYLGFVAAMMTAVTAVLAALAIGIGILAAFTFREIKDEAQKAASKRVNELVDEKLSDGAIKARINEIAFASNFDSDDTEER